MSEPQTKQPRPPQVTAAGLIVLLGSVFVVLLMWDRIAALHTTETQASLQAFLDRSKLQDDGVDVGAMTTVVKVVSMICAALAVAMAVQAWQVSKRSRSARVAVTVLTIPLFVTGLVGDGFVGSAAVTFWSSGVSAAVLTLWLGPARMWFGDASATLRQRPGQTPLQTPPQAGSGQSPWQVPPPGPGAGDGPGQPPPASLPFGGSPRREQTSSVVAAPPVPWTPPPTSAYDAPRPQAARPRALLWACVLTWVCTGLAAIGLTLSLAMLSADSDSMLDEVYRQNPQLADQGLSQHAVLAMLITICAVVLVAALAAAVFALLLFLRHQWAWYALLVSAAAAALLFLIGAFGSPVAIVLLGACVATIVCLVRPEVRTWLLPR